MTRATTLAEVRLNATRRRADTSESARGAFGDTLSSPAVTAGLGEAVALLSYPHDVALVRAAQERL